MEWGQPANGSAARQHSSQSQLYSFMVWSTGPLLILFGWPDWKLFLSFLPILLWLDVCNSVEQDYNCRVQFAVWLKLRPTVPCQRASSRWGEVDRSTGELECSALYPHPHSAHCQSEMWSAPMVGGESRILLGASDRGKRWGILHLDGLRQQLPTVDMHHVLYRNM